MARKGRHCQKFRKKQEIGQQLKEQLKAKAGNQVSQDFVIPGAVDVIRERKL